MFVSQACLHITRVQVSLHPRDQWNAKDTDMEKALLSHDVTSSTSGEMGFKEGTITSFKASGENSVYNFTVNGL